MSLGNIDKISSYGLAKKMADSLRKYGANIEFHTQENIGHWGWNSIYSDSTAISWLMSWTNPQSPKKNKVDNTLNNFTIER